MGIKEAYCATMINEVCRVVDQFEQYAEQANIREKTYRNMQQVLDANRVE